jgi:hypothetical protein
VAEEVSAVTISTLIFSHHRWTSKVASISLYGSRWFGNFCFSAPRSVPVIGIGAEGEKLAAGKAFELMGHNVSGPTWLEQILEWAASLHHPEGALANDLN